MIRVAGDSSSEDDDLEGFEASNFTPKKVFKRPVHQVKEETPFDLFKAAVYRNDFSKITESLTKGVQIDTPLFSNWTALMHACSLPNIELIQFLLENQANPNLSYEKMTSIIILLEKKGLEEIKLEGVKLLLTNHSKYNCFDKYDMTPLMYAVKNNFTNIAKLLLSLPKININTPDKKGQTPLILAVKNKNVEIVSLLVEAGALLDYHDNYNYTALDYAKTKDLNEIIKILSEDEVREEINNDLANSTNLLFQELFQELPFYSKTPFRSEISTFLCSINLFETSSIINTQEIDFEKFLCANDVDLKSFGILMRHNREQILENIKYFHLSSWEKSSLIFNNRKEISVFDLIDYLYNLLRILYIMTSSIKYLNNIVSGNSFQKENFYSKDMVDCKIEIIRSIKTCEEISKELKLLKKIADKFKANNKIDYGDLIRYEEKKGYGKKFKLFIFGGLSLFFMLLLKKDLKTFVIQSLLSKKEL